MSRGVQPVNVAPLIRGARYCFLIAGWFYGASKKSVLTRLEAVERVKRHAALEEEHRQMLQRIKKQTIEELETVFKEVGFTPEPGWQDSV